MQGSIEQNSPVVAFAGLFHPFMHVHEDWLASQFPWPEHKETLHESVDSSQLSPLNPV
jgi:hypothetical protein